MSFTALVVGCGYVGLPLAELLAVEGWKVWGIKRKAIIDPETFRMLSLDVTKDFQLPEPATDIDVVVYLVSAGEYSEFAYRKAYVEGLRNCIQYFEQQQKKPLLIFVSSTGVYGQNNGETVDENSVTEPTEFNGAILLEAEQLAASYSHHATSLRLGGIYGPGRTRMIHVLKEAAISSSPRLRRFTNRIHQEDAVRAIYHLLARDSLDDCYNIVDCHPAEEIEVLKWIADQLSIPFESTLSPSDPVYGKRCLNTRLLDSGFEFRYPSFKEGYTHHRINIGL